jgi:hypothetical protein
LTLQIAPQYCGSKRPKTGKSKNLNKILGELEHAFKLAPPKFVFTSAFAAGRVVKVAKRVKFVKNVIAIERKKVGSFVLSMRDLIKKATGSVEDVIAKPVDIYEKVAVILCSSGTTGKFIN